jgi:hypothetical protein
VCVLKRKGPPESSKSSAQVVVGIFQPNGVGFLYFLADGCNQNEGFHIYTLVYCNCAVIVALYLGALGTCNTGRSLPAFLQLQCPSRVPSSICICLLVTVLCPEINLETLCRLV